MTWTTTTETLSEPVEITTSELIEVGPNWLHTIAEAVIEGAVIVGLLIAARMVGLI